MKCVKCVLRLEACDIPKWGRLLALSRTVPFIFLLCILIVLLKPISKCKWGFGNKTSGEQKHSS
jgi:hypothetical protein